MKSEIKIDKTQTNLSKDCMFLLKFFCFVQCEKELTGIIILSSICHCNKASAVEFKTLMKFILNRKLIKQYKQYYYNQRQASRAIE